MIEMLKLGLVLMLVALIAAVALGIVNSRTAPIIEIQQELEKQNAMSEVAAILMPDDSLAFDSLSISNLENPYSSCDELLQVVKVYVPPDTSRIGYVFIAYGKGYSSTLQTMVAIRMDGRVAGTIILNQQETPGLGANIVIPSKLIEHLIGMTGPECLLSKDGGTIDAMTGCTITSRAVVNSVRQGLEDIGEAGLFYDDIALDEEPAEGGAE
ncbi:MAG: RnfABCDGE type electron transport complex subunit G [Candidatus Aegiribacteria sp.]|nr:RnfABCDGE type electron transport complex subunit G [Candidatus Aegiribacteria sp.]